MLNLAMLLEDSTREVPKRTAVIFEDTKLSYEELNATTNQVAHALVQLGIRRGDAVAISCQNIPYFPIVYYGILKAGAVVVPLNVLLKSREIAYHLQDAGVKAYFCQEGTSELPIGEMGFSAFQETDNCKHFFLMTNDQLGTTPIKGTQSLSELLQNVPATFEQVISWIC
jgi:long-chain acyl-CoA synthetase